MKKGRPSDLTAQRLRDLFEYEAGVFTRRADGARPARKRPDRDILIITIGGWTYSVERLAYLYVHGCWPAEKTVRGKVARPGFKVCSKCHQEKPRSEFYQRRDGGRLDSYCRECRAEIAHTYTVLDYRREANRLQHRKRYRTHGDEIRAAHNQRRARQAASTEHYTAADVKRLFQLQKGKCPACRASLKDGYDVDHVVALARGGDNGPRNIQLLCSTCNNQKWALDPVVFMQRKGFLL